MRSISVSYITAGLLIAECNALPSLLPDSLRPRNAQQPAGGKSTYVESCKSPSMMQKDWEGLKMDKVMTDLTADMGNGNFISAMASKNQEISEFGCDADSCGDINGFRTESLCTVGGDKGAQAAIVLSAVINYATLGRNIRKEIRDTMNTMLGNSASIIDDFPLPTSGGDGAMAAPILGMIGGLMGALSAIPVAGAAFGSIGGVFGIASNVAALEAGSAPKEPKFDAQADYERFITDNQKLTDGSIQSHFNTVLKGKTELSDALKGGYFLDPKIANLTAGKTHDAVAAGLNSVAVNYRLRKNGIVVVKANKASLKGLTDDPCSKQDGNPQFAPEEMFCQGGDLYALRAWVKDAQASMQVPNTEVPGSDKFKRWYADAEKIAKSSEARRLKPAPPGGYTEDTMREAITKGTLDVNDPTSFLSYDLPFCDLSTTGGSSLPDDMDTCGGRNAKDTANCKFAMHMFCDCPNAKGGWPEELTKGTMMTPFCKTGSTNTGIGRGGISA